jgi:NAD(P)-dependent dehydrogenase (short-subunit alcohol dehydrogenase family)
MTTTQTTDTLRGNRGAFIVTGPTSGFGRHAAFELAKHGTVVLVGRSKARLDEVKKEMEAKGQHAVSVVCDLSDVTSARRAAAEIVALGLPISALVNNAGISESGTAKSPQGFDNTFATNHLGPFALTEALVPYLPDGANVVFVCSATEDIDRKPAALAGFRGGRYLSAEASARGEWKAGGSTKAGFDAYATSKQCNLATALAFARETPRLRFNAAEPGFSMGTNLSRGANAFVRVIAKSLFTLFVPFIKYASTPAQGGRVIAKAALNEEGKTGVYYGERGQPMQGSVEVRDPQFLDSKTATGEGMFKQSSKMGTQPFTLGSDVAGEVGEGPAGSSAAIGCSAWPGSRRWPARSPSTSRSTRPTSCTSRPSSPTTWRPPIGHTRRWTHEGIFALRACQPSARASTSPHRSVTGEARQL